MKKGVKSSGNLHHTLEGRARARVPNQEGGGMWHTRHQDHAPPCRARLPDEEGTEIGGGFYGSHLSLAAARGSPMKRGLKSSNCSRIRKEKRAARGSPMKRGLKFTSSLT